MKLLFSGIGVLLLSCAAQAQAAVLVRPTYGKSEMGQGSGSYAPVWDVPGLAPDYESRFSMPFPGYTGSCSGSAATTRYATAGSIACGTGFGRGASSALYQMGIYGDFEPGSKVEVKFRADLSVSWHGGGLNSRSNFYFYSMGGGGVGFGLDRNSQPGLPDGPLNDSRQWSAQVWPSAGAFYETGGKKYYKLGAFDISGMSEIYDPDTNAGYSGAISEIQAYYAGGFVRKNEGDAQTGLVTRELEKLLSVKVSSGEAEAPLAGKAITFSIVEPASNARFSNGQTSMAVLTDTSGVAGVAFTLGTATGTYKVKATCPDNICTSGAKEVVFAAVAGTMDLIVIDGPCESNSAVGQKTAALRVGAYNTVTGQFEKNVPISFSRVSFTDMLGDTTLGFPGDEPLNCRVLSNGFRSCSPGPLRSEGAYAFKADCPQCLGVKSLVCRSYTQLSNVPASLPSASSANPFDRDPVTHKPLTPVVRVRELTTQNTNESFTTNISENLVGLKAIVLPEDFAEQSVITWNVIDDPRDNYASALPHQNPVPKPDSKFEAVYRVWLDNVPDGRPAPLRYLVTAKATVDDKEALSPYRELKQDEIDKCRQEYVDYEIPLNEVPKSTFTAGLHSRYSKQVRDCFAYIYPSVEAQKVDKLLAAGHQLVVTSGYRSPRHNIRYVESTARSTHIYGEAVDIRPVKTNLNAEGWKELWISTQTTCPKSLESSPKDVMMWCNGTQAIPQYWNSYPGTDDLMYQSATCIHLGNASKTLENTQ